MEKKYLLDAVKDLARAKTLTRDELLAAFEEGGGVKTVGSALRKVGTADVLYYIGGGIVCLGISILVWQNWGTLNVATRILVTFGSGLAAYFTGLFLGREERFESISSAFYFIAAVVTPLGLYVIFDNAGFDVASRGMQTLMSGIMLGMFFSSYFVFKKNVFLFFSILFGTWFYYAFASYLFGQNPDWAKRLEYLTLAVGAGYILLGHAFSKNEKAPLTGFLYGFGILGFLAAAFALGGWKPEQNIFWEIVFPGLALGATFLSVDLKSKAMLAFGSLYLMGYIMKITGEYFSSGLGWPLALVLAGLLLIAVGYFSLYLKKKYMVV